MPALEDNLTFARLATVLREMSPARVMALLVELGKEAGSADTLLSPEAVATRLAMSPRTVKEWLRQGKLRGLKVAGQLWRVREADEGMLVSDDNDEHEEDETHRAMLAVYSIGITPRARAL